MLRIAIAKSAEQIDAVLRLRSRYLVSAEVSVDSNEQSRCLIGDRLLDRFDTFPTTSHLVIVDNNNKLIGSLRLTQTSAVGHPLQPSTTQNQMPNLGNQSHNQMICDLFCLSPNVEKQQGLRGLVLMACYLAISKRMKYLIVAVPASQIYDLKDIGFTPLSDYPPDGPQNEKSEILMRVNLQTELDDSFIKFSSENELQDLIHAYGCALYTPGEAILRAGTTGNCAFVITSGEVEVRHPGNDSVIDTMSVGDVFGELALLTNQVRSADIIAKTPVRAMILEKAVFVEHLLAEPTAALKMLTSMGHRMKHLIDYCNDISNQD
ncbi:MAG: cyclic nucleotide-binding domain-containing protein [Cyanobacteria bacterium J06632_3]